jgi:hypothetical protein
MRKSFLNTQNVVMVMCIYIQLPQSASSPYTTSDLNVQAYIMFITFLSFLEITHVQSQSDQLLT